MRRREFITLIGGAVGGWPLAVRAQQAARVRRVSVLLGVPENDPETKSRVRGFRLGMRDAGWIEGRNVQIEFRYAGTDPDTIMRDVILKSAEQHRVLLSAPYRRFALDGGLMSYGPDTADIFRRSSSYVDRILKG